MYLWITLALLRIRQTILLTVSYYLLQDNLNNVPSTITELFLVTMNKGYSSYIKYYTVFY